MEKPVSVELENKSVTSEFRYKLYSFISRAKVACTTRGSVSGSASVPQNINLRQLSQKFSETTAQKTSGLCRTVLCTHYDIRHGRVKSHDEEQLVRPR